MRYKRRVARACRKRDKQLGYFWDDRIVILGGVIVRQICRHSTYRYPLSIKTEMSW